jgi:outer membrane protein assembly factor BamB/predicted phosphodiesterase
MRKAFLCILLSISIPAFPQIGQFRFAFLSDTHVGTPDRTAPEDLRRSVRDINAMSNVDFVVVTGDITELGDYSELRLAREILDSLDIPWYVIPGNHDTGWSESGGLGFTRVFGSDRFVFDHKGVRFFGCPSGPYVRMSDGHVPRSAIIWMDSVLEATPPRMPLIFLNHYPINDALDNWYEVIDRLRKHNTISILCGHGHRNKALDFEGIPGTMGRSNLRVKAPVGGYNLVDMRGDSIIFSERRPGVETLPPWRKIKVGPPAPEPDADFPRPSYAVNKTYPEVRTAWTFSSDANVISTPAVVNGKVIFGNQNGVVKALSLADGTHLWTFSAGSPIFSSPASDGESVVFGTAGGYVYCLSATNGTVRWKYQTDASVLGSPLVHKGIVYVGGSDGHFRSFDMMTGKVRWDFDGLNGPVVSTPLFYRNMIVFGAWDRYLYALDSRSGAMKWKWTNGSPVRNYSPAACIPVATKGVIYIVAPDRFITAIDARSGKTLWRNNDATVRESIGISHDGRFVYGKTMQDTIVAYRTSREKQAAAWKLSCGFGYEHVPSMLIEKEENVFFGTRNGVVYGIDPKDRKVLWAHKIDNSMVNTVRVLSGRQIIASTMDGKVVLLEARK